MTGTAILFLLISAAIIWGGLALSIVRLRRDGGADEGQAPHDLSTRAVATTEPTSDVYGKSVDA